MPVILNIGAYGESNVASPQDTGFVSLTTFSNFSTVSGTEAHQNPNFAATLNGFLSGSVVASTRFLQVLGCQNLIMPAIPLGAIITGVTVRYQAFSIIGTGIETFARLIVGGVLTGDQKNAGQFYPGFAPSPPYNFTRGGSADTWGLSLTAAQVNASNFGFGASLLIVPGFVGAAGIDHVQMRINFTA